MSAAALFEIEQDPELPPETAETWEAACNIARRLEEDDPERGAVSIRDPQGRRWHHVLDSWWSR